MHAASNKDTKTQIYMSETIIFECVSVCICDIALYNPNVTFTND